MKKKQLSSVLAAVLLFHLGGANIVLASEADAANNVVSTKYGLVQGINSSDPSYAEVVEFRGIPYAAPPVGELRWKAPQDPESWDGIKVCDTYQNMPMQDLQAENNEPYTQDFYYGEIPEMSEDCLYLNVTTTEENLTSEDKKPVFVWFHGGGLSKCYTNEPEANGEAYAMNGIVVVSVEQRLGAFGYLSLPQLTEEQGQSGNYGLMDQIKAMEWIYENIENFGGDPENITIGGQSGGTTKSMAMASSPECDTPIRKMVLQSGLKWADTFLSQDEAEEKGLTYLEDLGIDPEISLDELRNMDTEDLFDTTSAGWSGKMVQDDLYLVYPSIADATLDGVYDDIAILAGTNIGEGTAPEVTNAEEFYAYYKDLLGELYDKYDFENLVQVTDANAAIVARQLGSYGLGMNGSRSIMVNRLFGKLLDERTDGASTVYTYLFTHITPESITDIGTNRSAATCWSWHSSELWYTFNSLRLGTPPVREWTSYDFDLAKEMNTYWSNFMKNGNPNGDGLTEWPESDSSMAYLKIGNGTAAYSDDLTTLEQLMEEFTAQYFSFPAAS